MTYKQPRVIALVVVWIRLAWRVSVTQYWRTGPEYQSCGGLDVLLSQAHLRLVTKNSRRRPFSRFRFHHLRSPLRSPLLLPLLPILLHPSPNAKCKTHVESSERSCEKRSTLATLKWDERGGVPLMAGNNRMIFSPLRPRRRISQFVSFPDASTAMSRGESKWRYRGRSSTCKWQHFHSSWNSYFFFRCSYKILLLAIRVHRKLFFLDYFSFL